jgi:hypothetical protein
VDNKRKHLEKPLSAAKRDEVLLRAAKEDIALKKEHMLNMQKSQDALIEMGKSMSASLNTLGRSVSDGLGLLAMALNPNVMQMTNNSSFGNNQNAPPPINHYRTQGFYTNTNTNINNQQPPHMPQGPYQEPQRLSGMFTHNNINPAQIPPPRYQGMHSDSNSKTYEQL